MRGSEQWRVRKSSCSKEDNLEDSWKTENGENFMGEKDSVKFDTGKSSRGQGETGKSASFEHPLKRSM